MNNYKIMLQNKIHVIKLENILLEHRFRMYRSNA
jgi:hypothetical protein